MSSARPVAMSRSTVPSATRWQARIRAQVQLCRGGLRAWPILVAAAAAVLLLTPAAAHADAPHDHARGGHFAVGRRGPRGGRADGGHWHGGAPGRQWARPAARGDWHGHGRGPDWQGRGRPDWHGDGGRDYRGDWRGEEHWHAGWDRGDWGRGDWDRRWHGAAWMGGDWGGLYWPPVDYGWNYPWFMATIPMGAMTLTFGGVPYYYINHVYYAWSPYYEGYVVADPPPVADTGAPAEPPAAGPPPAQASQGGAHGVLGLQVSPLKGQDAQQTANDRYACDRWAVAQSGFNPIDAQQDAQASPQMRSDYRRAFTACLHARGYSVH